MFKTEIEYRKDTLFVEVEGPLTKKNMQRLKQKLSCILGEYGIDRVVMNIEKSSPFDQEEFDYFLDEYDTYFGGSLKVIR